MKNPSTSELRTHAVNTSSVDALNLQRELNGRIQGEVRFGDGDRALYSTDSSNYRQIPIGVVVPRNAQDVITTFEACRRFGAPITSRGGGTSLAGQCCNVAVIIDYTKYMNNVLEVDVANKRVCVEPGIVLDMVNKKVGESGLVFGPDPATHSHCAIGGMIGNNSCGVHSVMAQFYGGGARTSDNVESLKILTYDGLQMWVGKTSDAELEQIIRDGGRRGEIYGKLKLIRDKYADLIRERFPKIPRRVSGYNLDELLPENGFNVARALVGTEGTCVAVLEATLQLIRNPSARSLVMLGYPDVFAAGDHVPEVLKHRPVGLEGLDDVLVKAMHVKQLHIHDLEMLPRGNGWLLVEFGAETREESDEKARKLMEELGQKRNAPAMKLFEDPEEEEKMWNVRDAGLGASARVPNEPDTWEGWEDAAVPPEKVGPYLRDFRALLNKFGYLCTLYGHFGQGTIHTRIDFGLKNAAGIKKYLEFTDEAADLVIRYGGSLSGEHGDGQSRGELLGKMFGNELVQAFREFKAVWDPEWKMNPGKIVHPYHRDENLRYGMHYNPPQWRTRFKYPKDKGSFSYALERCVGVGQCRRHEKGTMCPSYMATLEEKHSTRGRARMLWELLEGHVIGKRGWKERSVKEALDLCLSCKGCKSDCPVNVDMATYKAEFLSHYYKGRLRPLHAYAFGFIHVWARLANIAPRFFNFFGQNRFFSGIAKWAVGIAPERRLPAFASESFKEWFKRRPQPADIAKRRPVILWPDTFNNYFHPWIAQAAVEVLEDAGFYVKVPKQDMCCGRPLYDYGMVGTAEKWLKQILRVLHSDIEAGTPMVVLEPSCGTVFRDELLSLMPNDENAIRLNKQTFLLSEFLNKYAPNYPVKQLERKAVVHMHCHHRAVMKINDEKAILQKLGLDYAVLDSGCCGMAGAFGFEKGDHYDVSIKCGERVLLPEVRKATDEELVITNGFSCHEQILQQTRRQALHLAQVLQLAKREGQMCPPEEMAQPRKAPEKEDQRRELASSDHYGLKTLGLIILAGAWLYRRWSKDV